MDRMKRIVRMLDKITNMLPPIVGNGWQFVRVEADGTRVFEIRFKS